MVFSRLLLAGATVAAFAVVGSAGTIPGDPDISVDPGYGSNPLTNGTNFVPTNGGGVFYYYNPFAATITSLEFQADIAGGLTQSEVGGVFELNGDPFNCQSSFFVNCGFGYQDFTTYGLLTIDFSGVIFGNGSLGGIPPLLPGCILTPDAPGCTSVGHFAISLNYNFAQTGDPNGGWSNTNSPGLFNGTPSTCQEPNTPADVCLNTQDVGTAPEPATWILLGTAILIGAISARRRPRNPSR